MKIKRNAITLICNNKKKHEKNILSFSPKGFLHWFNESKVSTSLFRKDKMIRTKLLIYLI